MLLEQFTAMLDRIELSESMYGWLVRALKENFGELHRDHDAAVSRLQSERARCASA
ncbi:hypothetical protein [Sphingomonas gei]|uniref:hypothetical protein n=1 Tax=Sphingomonas gei TaxID=1395960 RepID=UPI0014415C8A|nr:hypothetical protein [Sphingomonas gei]